MKLPVQATCSAFDRMKEINADPEVEETRMLRVSVLGGGCSGFRYEIELVESSNSDDTVLGEPGCEILIDPVSIPFLSGATIDFERKIVGSRFVIDNPIAASSCGCGTSFSI
jgi:iron-sulfur cluster assembly accessory protein